MDQQGLITRAGLGRMASIGDLYDARADKFCGISVFKQSIPPAAFKTLDADSFQVKLIHGDSYSEMFSKLDVEEELAMSVLSRLVSLEGSGRFLGNGKESDLVVKSSLLYKLRRKDETLNIYNDGLKDAFEVNAIKNGLGTHVVTGISWGASLILSCMYENLDNRDQKVVQENLSAQMKKLASLVSGSASSAGFEKDKSIQYKMEVFGEILQPNSDFSSFSLTTSFAEALQLMKRLPSMISTYNEGKGKPLVYRLVPISLLQQSLDLPLYESITFKVFEEGTSAHVVVLFDEILDAKRKLYDLHNAVEEHNYCIMTRDIWNVSKMRKNLDISETGLRTNLYAELLHVRSGKKSISGVEHLIQNIRSGPTSPEKVLAAVRSWKDLVEKISFVKGLLESGAKYVGNDASLEDELIKAATPSSKNFIFLFKRTSSSEDSLRLQANYQLFLQEIKKKKGNNDRGYFAVDCDIHPDLLPKTFSSCVQVINGGGMTVTEDLLQDQENTEAVALARAFSGTMDFSFNLKPSKSIPLVLPCTEVNCDGSREYEWTCEKCFTKFEYGFDKHVYCKCGRTSILQLTFKCPDPDHGDNFEWHRIDFLSKFISKLQPPKELNILILGETGVGKSTWINGFINYLTFESMQAAEAGELCTLIPSQFTVFDAKFNKITVSTGSDENEVLAAGQSATQEPKVYPLNVGETKVRLIDTPGIGDTRGIEQDKKNFKNILGTLSHLDEIHGICILLKPNNSRLNVMFRFCIKELLTYLHRDASKNIVFCFTNSRGTFYRPGDTMPTLMSLLEENKTVEIAVNPETVYCFDSEAYRFLASVKNNPPVQFTDDERDNFSKSWEKSITETKRMLKHIEGLAPHPIQSTMNLNQARQMVLKMVRPLAEISRNIQTNKAIVEDEKIGIYKTNANSLELKSKQMTTRTVIEVKKLDYPKTVCSNSDCVKIWTVEGVSTTEYVTVRHDHCQLKDVTEDTIGDPLLMYCWAMKDTKGICRLESCGHHYREHLHIYYDSIQVVKSVEDQTVNESLSQNLKHLIREEQDKVALGGNSKTLDSLVLSMESYLHEKSILEQQMQMGGGSVPQPGEVDVIVKKLKGLKHSGQMLKDALDCVDYASKQVYNEAVVRAPKRRYFSQLFETTKRVCLNSLSWLSPRKRQEGDGGPD